MSIWTALLDLLFPPRCPFCGKIQDRSGVCPICQKNLPLTREGESVRLLEAGLRCAAPLWYEDIARQGLLRFKFHEGVSAADCLGEMIAQCAAEAFYGEFDLVTWVPVSRKRLRRRGYDQAELLARAACRVWQAEPKRLLRKSRHTPAQSGLRDASQRRDNVLAAYEVLDPAMIAGHRILLIDDICTTGATLRECARVLREAGAAEVMCAVAARTPSEKDGKTGKSS